MALHIMATVVIIQNILFVLILFVAPMQNNIYFYSNN